MKQPREYQQWAHDATITYVHNPVNFTGGAATDGKGPRYPLVVEATGLGKSLNIAMFIWHMLSMYPHLRMMQLCHVKELVQSNYEELLGMWPAAPAGVYAAGLGEKNANAQITFAMINSVHKRPATFGHVDFLLIDEAHRMSPSDSAMYAKFIEALRKKNPALIVIGYTATDYRMKGGRLTDMGLFDEVVYDIGSGESFLWAVQQGYLIMPVPTDPGFKLDDTGIGLTGGDFHNGDASRAMHEQDIIERAVDYAVEVAREENRRCGVAFAQSIDDAELIADMLTYKGFPTEAVHSKRGDRDEVLEAHKRGELWGVANKDILTTGWNNPLLDLMIGLRLTRSPGLWVQMVGRMTRPAFTNHFYGHNGGPPLDDMGRHNVATYEGRWASILQSHKQNARVLDFVGNTERLGPINYPNIPRKRKKGGGDAPVRTCSADKNWYPDDTPFEERKFCSPATFHHTSVKVCPFCGYEWPEGDSNIDVVASDAVLVSGTNPLGLEIPKAPEKVFDVFGVHQMICAHNAGKNGKLDTMRVDYRCGIHRYSSWVCFDHYTKDPGGFPYRKAKQWWTQHGGSTPEPTSVEEALERQEELQAPRFVKCWVNTKYPEIVAFDHEGTRFEEQSLADAIEGKAMKVYSPEPDPLAEQIEQAQRAQEAAAAAMGDGYFDDDIPF